MTILPKEDKKQIIQSRIRGLEYKKYTLDLDILVENAKTAPESESILNINNAIAEVNNQIAVLNTELETVEALTE